MVVGVVNPRYLRAFIVGVVRRMEDHSGRVISVSEHSRSTARTSSIPSDSSWKLLSKSGIPCHSSSERVSCVSG